MARLTFSPRLREAIPSSAFTPDLREPRKGVMLHFDASASDEGAVAWFRDPRCRVSYHYLVLDDGQYAVIAPRESRAWHAGKCRPSDPARLDYRDANSAFYGIAAATNQLESATLPQVLTIAWLTRHLFNMNNWSSRQTWRIVGHEGEAWPRGRKVDPTGLDPKRPILNVPGVRGIVPRIEVVNPPEGP